MTKSRMIPAFLALAFLIPVMIIIPVQAASGLNVNLYAKTDMVKAGDTIALNVNFDSFPNLTRFGPIEVQFDTKYVSFAGMDKGSTMPSTFSVSNSASTNVIAIIGVDQTVEGIIGANQTAPTADASGNPLTPPIDPSMKSDSTVTCCVLYFKVIDTAPTGDANFWLGSIGGFKNSSLAQLQASAGNTVIVPVQSLLSSEASLLSLSIDGAALTPAFSPSVFAYETHVTRDITAVNVTAAAADPSAQLLITGKENLALGNNTVTVKVSAQDGKTALEYKINVIRESNFVPAGASITGSDGKVYTFIEIPQTLTLPAGFAMQMEMLGTSSVPVFTGNGFKSMLLYLKDGENDPALYLYNPDNGSIRIYDADLTVTIPSRIMTVTELPAGVAVPDGFSAGTVETGGLSVPGYISDTTDTALLYLTDEAGISLFYKIDSSTGSLTPYKEVKAKDSSFLIPFVIVSVLAAAELGMIAYIIYQVRSRNRPKEVKRV